MNKDILIACGFGQAVKDVENGICPLCKKKVNPEDFTDEGSKKEYKTSGLCQKCQDETFG